MPQTREQLALSLGYNFGAEKGLRDAAASENKSLPIHRWVPWIAGFSAQFVEDALKAYLPKSRKADSVVLDPFAGVGTTLVEALKNGHDVVGYEINPFAALAAGAKLSAGEVDPSEFKAELEAFGCALARFEDIVDRAWLSDGEAALASLTAPLQRHKPRSFRSRIPFFSPPVEAKFLYALARVAVVLEPNRALFRAALGAIMVAVSNYSYEPSLGSRPGSGKPLIDNASVVAPVRRKLGEMLTDVEWTQQNYGLEWLTHTKRVVQASYFASTLKQRSVSLIVTSPPYMNNYHYLRNTRPQLYWLGLLNEDEATREFETESYGKFWQTVRQAQPIGLEFESSWLSSTLSSLRAKNPEKGYYGGSGWANYVATYMNDSHRFIAMIAKHLKVGGRAVIVVGNSIIQGIEFPVDRLLAELAENQGLRVENIQVVRTKRVGNSIIDSSVRNGDSNGHRDKTQLYDAAVILQK
jgi:SAM-dependent methyltransferase